MVLECAAGGRWRAEPSVCRWRLMSAAIDQESDAEGKSTATSTSASSTSFSFCFLLKLLRLQVDRWKCPEK